jgi:hypothetical protein
LVVKPLGEDLGEAPNTGYNWLCGPWGFMHFWGDVKLWGSVFGVGFLKTSVKVGLFGLWQCVTVGTVCLSKGSTSTSEEEVSSFSLGQAFVGVNMSKVVKAYSVDVLLTFLYCWSKVFVCQAYNKSRIVSNLLNLAVL